MATLTKQVTSIDGIEPTYAAADVAGDEVVNSGSTMLHIKNGSGGAIVVTVTAQRTSLTQSGYGVITITDSVVSIPAGEERMIGTFPTDRFNDGSGKIQITYDGVTSLTVAAIEATKQ